MRQSEILASKLLQKIFPNTCVVLNDTGKEPSAYDFSIIQKGTNKQHIAVEVTTTTIEWPKKTLQIIEKNRVLKTQRLKRRWHLFVSPSFACLNKISRKLLQLENYLLPMEKAEIKSFFAPMDSARNAAIKAIWTDLKVEACFSYSDKNPRIVLSSTGSGGHVSSSQIQNMLEREAFKEDNLKKLKQVPNDIERHLFIIIDEETDYLTWKAMTHGKLPIESPVLPMEINVVWLASWVPASRASYLVWRVSLTEGWEIIGQIKIDR